MLKPIDISNARILLVNDDGIDAPGLQALRRVIDPMCELTVVAPLNEQSGSGCGLTVRHEMAVEKRRDESGKIWGYAVDGTPADCVKFARLALGEYRPDLVLSGINKGSNVGNSVFYSGTVAGAMEATLFGMRAMAISLSHKAASEFHFDTAARVTRQLVPWLLTQSWHPRSFWNLNLPNVPFEELEGVRFTHQGTSFYTDDFEQARSEADGTEYWRNIGAHLVVSPEPAHSDDLVVERNNASLSLLKMDLTVEIPTAAREALEREWTGLVFGE